MRICGSTGGPSGRFGRPLSLGASPKWTRTFRRSARPAAGLIRQYLIRVPRDTCRPRLPPQIRQGGRRPPDAVELPEEGLDLEAHLDVIRRHLMEQALERTGGVQTPAAELLHMTFRSFRYYAKKVGIGQANGATESVEPPESSE